MKFLSVAPDLEVIRAVIKQAPNGVIWVISNGALNSRQGALNIQPHLIFFRHHNHHFVYLVDRKKSIPSNQNLVFQNGGSLPIIVPLLATGFGLIGGEFISKLMRKNDQ